MPVFHRRRSALAATAALLFLGSAAAGAGAGGNGVLLSAPIQTQARRPLPAHKLRMLFGEDDHGEGYRRFLEEAAPAPKGDLPLHAGYGTHYAFVYVGTPAQRVSVILDTGSHWTAFPCTGCQQCGDDHTDPVFDVAKSSSYHALGCSECKFSGHCADDRCSISLSYAEGSRWDAYEVQDNLFLGGDELAAPIKGGSALAMPFVFGCQTYETGLFRTQLEDGIMGLSFQDLTIIPKLKEAGKIDHTLFSLCFTEDGGSMRLGGYETAHHTAPLQWVPLTKPTGWYTVTLKDIKIGDKSIGVDMTQFNSGQGTIVDSGTTDTYLPRGVASAFQSAFKAVAGVDYSTRSMRLTEEQFKALPDLHFVLDNGVTIPMPWENYIECDGGSCAGAIFLDNGQGAVLGANFMRGNDVVFDLDNQKIGFAPATCDYKEGAQAGGAAALPAAIPAEEEEAVDCEVTFGEAAGECSAVCPKDAVEDSVVTGEQLMHMKVSRPASGGGKACPATPLADEKKPCMVECKANKKKEASAAAAAAKKACNTDLVWDACSEACEQHGTGQQLADDGVTCQTVSMTRSCSTGELCAAAKDGVIIDLVLVLKGIVVGEVLLVGEEPAQRRTLSPGSESVLLSQVSELLSVPAGDLEILSSETGGKAAVEKEAEENLPLSVRLHIPRATQAAKVGGGVGDEDPDPLAQQEEEAAAAELPARAKELNETVYKPAFSTTLLAKLKASGGAFATLDAVELSGSHLQDLSTQSNKAPKDAETRNINVFLWNVVGGAAALFVGLMLVVHFRWNHWQSLSQTAASSGPGQVAAAAFERIRQGTESIGSVAALGGSGSGAGGGGGGGGGSGAKKPNPRSYELVEGARIVGEDEEEVDIEML